MKKMTIEKDIIFYDTSALLIDYEHLVGSQEKFLISSITLQELEDIKTSRTKDEKIKYHARRALHFLMDYPDSHEVIIHKTKYEDWATHRNLDINNDVKILCDVFDCNCHMYPDLIRLYTADLAMAKIAELFIGNGNVHLIRQNQEIDEYEGCKKIIADEEILARLYSDNTYNTLNLLENQYGLVYNQEHELIDIRVWRDGGNRHITEPIFNSTYFGKVIPYQNDPYQKCLFDSFVNNQITLVRGSAGSGKTYCALSFLLYALEKHIIDRIIIFCNPVATMNSAKLGYYPGDRKQKLMDSQIGNLLISKFGGEYVVNQLMDSEKLVLLPLSDIRGYDTTGMRAGIYISEAQNMDKELMKLALQRIGEDSICIIDGDDNTQVDLIQYAGANNGMKRLSQVFRGKDMYGEVTLQNIYRSRIAAIAQEM